MSIIFVKSKLISAYYNVCTLHCAGPLSTLGYFWPEYSKILYLRIVALNLTTMTWPVYVKLATEICNTWDV